MSTSWPGWRATIVRQASPHSAASVCMTRGVRAPPPMSSNDNTLALIPGPPRCREDRTATRRCGGGELFVQRAHVAFERGAEIGGLQIVTGEVAAQILAVAQQRAALALQGFEAAALLEHLLILFARLQLCHKTAGGEVAETPRSLFGAREPLALGSECRIELPQFLLEAAQAFLQVALMIGIDARLVRQFATHAVAPLHETLDGALLRGRRLGAAASRAGPPPSRRRGCAPPARPRLLHGSTSLSWRCSGCDQAVIARAVVRTCACRRA